MKNIFKLALAAALSGGVATLHAATLDTTSAGPTNDGILQNFSGIDWEANGGGWVQGFNPVLCAPGPGCDNTGVTDTFTFTYQAFAGGIGTTSTTDNLRVGSPINQPGTYELTTYATLTETALCLTATCDTIRLTVNSGSWDVYFDNSPDANQAAGTGFVDGVSILSGTWDSGSTLFGLTGPGTGTGGGFLTGTVTSTNNAYVNPDLLGTTIQSSLQFPGQTSPTYTRPALFNGVPTGADSATDFVLQTDTSQNYTAIPEPAVLAMLGLGLLGVPLAKRLRAAKVSG